MKRVFISALLGLALFPQMAPATDAIYTNNGFISFPPQIDAFTVINNGTFSFTTNVTFLPFDTSNTKNFTNNGTMIGSIGFRFDQAPSGAGVRKPMANWRNRVSGSITALDAIEALTLIDNVVVNPALLDSSFLTVSATNILNEGSLVAGSAGILRIEGTNVNLTRSGLQIAPIAAIGSVNDIFPGFFVPDVGIYDKYWGQGSQTPDSSTIITEAGTVVVTSPSSAVDFVPFYPFTRIFGNVSIQLINPVGEFYTNTIATTNLMATNMMGVPITLTNVPVTNIVQAVFLGLPETGGVDWGIRFFPSENPLNMFQTVSVGVSVFFTNVTTAGQDLLSFYLTDTLASLTNRGLLTNYADVPNLRPANYVMQRLEPFEFFFGVPGNAPFSTNLLYMPDFFSKFVTNDYAAYSAFVDNIASRPPNIPTGTPTNLPGRIEIHADNLDLTRTRLRANGLVDIKAKNLISSTNTIVDSENLSYNLGAVNGNLKIQNLAQQSVARLMGTNRVWSGLWTNHQNMILTNYVPNPTNSSLYVPVPFTNVVTYLIYAMIFDTTKMLSEVPVVVNDLITHSTNVVINDSMTLVQSLLIDGQSFTLNGTMTLSNKTFINNRGDAVIISLHDWVGTNTPALKFFTNNGTLNIPNEAHFGDDLSTPYSAFVNHGAIDSVGQTITSDYVEITGQNNPTANLLLTAHSAKLEGASLNVGAELQVFADELKFNHTTIQAGSGLDLTVTNSLSDAGGASGNSFSSSAGFRLPLKPANGDLLGTAFNSIAPPFAEVDHLWAATDFGPSSAGYQNNVALGTLVLTPGQLEAQFPPLFFFEGTGGGNALYVDLLDLSHLADIQEEIAINSDLVIYYAAAKLSFTPPLTNGAAQLPEEYLDGQFNGHLRWVRDFAGPNSQVAVIINGVSVLVNRALRESLIIDSDGDGIPNGLDFFPFDNSLVAKLKVIKPPMTAELSWNAIAYKVYSVQATTNFLSPSWQTVLYYTNSASTNGTVTVHIPVPPGSPRQFYRVGTAN